MPECERSDGRGADALLRALARRAERRLAAGAIDRNTYYDTLTALVMARVVRPDAVCLDVGCHAGDLLAMMVAFAPGGRFHGFEPLPAFHARLVREFPGPAFRFHRVALSDAAGTSTFNHVTSNPAYSGLLRRRYDRPHETEESIEVQTARLDDVLRAEGVDRVDFIKIDVEGAELRVLRGAVDTLARHRPYIVFEHGLGAADWYGTRPQQVHALLAAQGLSVSRLADWLGGRPALDERGFAAAFDGGDYYFLAHP